MVPVCFTFLIWIFGSLPLLPVASRVQTITCHQAEYSVGDICCPMCSPGNRVKTDCTELRTTSCQPCSAGTHIDVPNGLKRCSPCSTCDKEGVCHNASSWTLK
uniref:TNFR-Cys domain-containing protein n=1 Tax=Cyprinodon variegatus TaxID=28743 RepID=A0A3Q2CJT3_CYPVA